MRDVIVIGAGAGGPVVAKELAAKVLDVLVVEAGPRHDKPRRQWTSITEDANNPLTGYFRVGPRDRAKPAWFRELVQNSLIMQADPRRVPYRRAHRRRVSWRENDTGAEHRETAKVVVMAGGCVENPRLWLNSGLPNPNGWVGRGVTTHAIDWVVGVFDHPVGCSQGMGSAARLDFPPYGGLESVGVPPALHALAMSLSASGIRGQYTNGGGTTGPWDGPAGRVFGPELKDMLTGGLDNLMSVGILTNDDVEADNRILLSGLPGDENGPIPRAHMLHNGKRTARTRRNREFLTRKATESPVVSTDPRISVRLGQLGL